MLNLNKPYAGTQPPRKRDKNIWGESTTTDIKLNVQKFDPYSPL